MVWPFVHRGLVVSAGVNPWKLFGFGMYCTPYEVQVRLATAEGNRVRPIPIDKIPAEHRRALLMFESRRASLGQLASHEELARYLAAGLPSSERYFLVVEVTTMDPRTATLKTSQELFPVTAGRSAG